MIEVSLLSTSPDFFYEVNPFKELIKTVFVEQPLNLRGLLDSLGHTKSVNSTLNIFRPEVGPGAGGVVLRTALYVTT